MTSMRERLNLVGGECRIQSQPTGGTTVLARAPVREASAPRQLADPPSHSPISNVTQFSLCHSSAANRRCWD